MEALIAEWRRLRPEYAPFVIDGILDETIWETAAPKILFLLKESYGGWYQIKGPINVIDGGNKEFWPNICRWKHLIKSLHQGVLPQFPELSELEEWRDGSFLLRDIAYVNIKKKLGGSTSNARDIMDFALRDQDFLRRQIDLIDPAIVLCGGTFWPYHAIYSGNTTMHKASDRVWCHGKRQVIDFKHPGNWQHKGGAAGLYNELLKILKNQGQGGRGLRN